MNTDTKKDSNPETSTKRSEQEKRADAICEALDLILPVNESVSQVIWEYFRDRQDHLALMLIQAASLDQIVGYVEEINMSTGCLQNLLDENGNLSVHTRNLE